MVKKTGKAEKKQEETDVGEQALWNDWRIWLLAISLLIALFAINPHYTQTDTGETTIGTELKKGLDLKGGTRLLVKPEGNVTQEELQQIVDTLKARVNAYGLAEITIKPVQTKDQRLVQIEAAGTQPEQLEKLVAQQGRFEARFNKDIIGNTTFTLGTQQHTATHTSTGVTVNNEEYTVNDTFTLNAGDNNTIHTTVLNHSANKAVLSFLAFDGSAIQDISQGAQSSRFTCRNVPGCQYRFRVIISQPAANQFTAVTQAFNRVPHPQNPDEEQLDSNINFYLDREQVSSLSVGASFQDSPVTTPTISGGADTEEAALQERDELQAMLQSGALPTPITIVSTVTVSAALGAEFTQIAITAILVAVLGVAGILYARYRDYKITAPIAVTGFSEVFILLGLFSELQISWIHALAVLTLSGIGTYFCYRHEFKALFYLPLGSLLALIVVGINPTLDLPAVAGIIAAVGTGVDDQIVMADEGRETHLRDLWDRIKRAFFIIFTAAASTIGAMIPLYFVGAGALKGFAITTIIGVLVGIFITRPAYAQILIHFHEDYER